MPSKKKLIPKFGIATWCALALTTIVAFSVTVLLPSNAAAISVPFQLLGNAYLRSGPGVTYTPISVLAAGVSPNVVCWTRGTVEDGVDVWFEVINAAGQEGYYSSSLDNSTYPTDAAITSEYSIPACGTPGLQSPTVNPQGDGNVNIQGSTPTLQGGSASGSGSSSSGSPASSTPAAASQPPDQGAIDWALSKQNQDIYIDHCLGFVMAAESQGANINIGSSYSAATYWQQNPEGYTEHTDTSPEIGAMVFWGATATNPDGHVGIYVGNDTVVSSVSWPESDADPAIHTWSFSGRNALGYPFEGWMMP